MTDMYVQVNIGSDLDGEVSVGFENAVNRALLQSIRNPDQRATVDFESHQGQGFWNAESEQSLHISVVADVDLFTLRARLRKIKSQFNQDTIGLIVGSDLL